MECARLGAALDTSSQLLSILISQKLPFFAALNCKFMTRWGIDWLFLNEAYFFVGGPYPKRSLVARTPQKSLGFLSSIV